MYYRVYITVTEVAPSFLNKAALGLKLTQHRKTNYNNVRVYVKQSETSDV